MTTNRVEVELFARDLLTPVLDRITGRYRGMANAHRDSQGRLRDTQGRYLAETRSGFGSLFNFIQGGFGTALGVGAFLGLTSAATSAVGFIKDKIGEAAQIQTRAIATASDLSERIGVPVAKAKSALEGFQMKLIDIADTLPGETQDYQALFDQITDPVAKVYKDLEAFGTNAIDISKRAGVLAARKQLGGEQAGFATAGFLGGTRGFGELMQLDLFQKNPKLVEYIRTGSQQLGLSLDNLKKWSNEQRMAVLQFALRAATPDSMIKDFDGSVESMLQSVKTALFNPMKGVFGLLRRVSSEGDRTALDAFGNMFDKLSKLGAKLGQYLGIDPMAGLIKIFDFVSDVTDGINGLIGGKIQLPPPNVWGEMAGNFIGDVKLKLTRMLDTVPWVQVGAFIGQVLMTGVFELNDLLVSPGFWMGTATLLVRVISAALELLGGVVAGLVTGLIDRVKEVWSKLMDSLGWLGRQLGIGRQEAPKDTGNVLFETPTGLQGVQPLSQPDTTKVENPIGLQIGTISVNTTSNATADDISTSILDKLDRTWGQKKQEVLK